MVDQKGQDFFVSDKLHEALREMTLEVKSSPTDLVKRKFFCDLLCIAGDLERADKQLEIIADQDPKTAVGIALFRQLIRAETWRRECFFSGRVPEFLDAISPNLKAHLQALTLLREKDSKKAFEVLQKSGSLDPIEITGTCNGKSFAKMRDLDDITSCFFEVLTSNGKYFWIPQDRVKKIDFYPPKRPLDLLWRRVKMEIYNGPDGEVYIPAIYLDQQSGQKEPSSEEDSFLLGRKTDWVGEKDGLIRGRGQRMFLFDDTDYSIMELETIIFSEAKKVKK